MKLLCFSSILLFCLLSSTQAQSPDWLWEKGSKGSGGGLAASISLDAFGNAYVTGNYYGTIILGMDTLTSGGSANFFIVKYDPSGNVLWAKSAGGLGNDPGESISTDVNGNVYVYGEFSNSLIIFGPDTLADSLGQKSVFIVKYDSLGNVIWAKNSGGINIYAGGITTDIKGNAYITGYYTDSNVVFGSYPLNDIYGESIFVAKIDSSGNAIWVKSSIGLSIDNGIGIGTDNNGNVYVTGNFSSRTIVFGNDTLTNADYYDVFLVKYDSLGDVVWARKSKGTNSDFGGSISIDNSGYIYLAGSFSSPVIVFETDTLINAGNYNNFLVKYDAIGNVLWAKDMGGSGSDETGGIRVDKDGNIFATGGIGSPTMAFGTDTLTNPSTNQYLSFIAKYNTSGNVIWVKSTGGSSGNGGTDLGVDASGYIYLIGYYNGSSMAFDQNILSNSASINLYIAKLDTSSTTGIISINPSYNITIYPNPSSGNFYFDDVKTGYAIEVYNTLGERVYSAQAESDKYTVRLSGRPRGMYIYKVSSNGTTIQQGKIIVE